MTMTTTRTETTTESPADAASTRGSRFQASVRTRIVATIAILAAAAMTFSGLMVYVLESTIIDGNISEQIDQEVAEFRALEGGVDPDTGEPFERVDRLLQLFLDRNVADDNEMLVAVVDGEVLDATPHPFRQEFIEADAFDLRSRLNSARGSTTRQDLATFGETWVTIIPVTDVTGSQQGALIVVNFVEAVRAELNRTMALYAIVAAVSLGILLLIATWQSWRLLAPLKTLRTTARDITAQDLSRRIPEKGNDDITALTRTVNDMLDRLEAGVDAQRRFLDDAGHELKTPLTVVRGHLELLASDDAEVTETRDLVLDEVDRMARLVQDLLLLAKARTPEFVNPAPVAVEELFADIAAKAETLGQRDWRLVPPPAQGAPLALDAQRITQAMLQLTENAVKHTDPGAVVELGAQAGPEAVRFWVGDSGDGIAPADRERVFERFGRAEFRAGDEGFGLGLSIVSAIVAAHGGSVEIGDSGHGGAQFELTIPHPATSGIDDEGATWLRS